MIRTDTVRFRHPGTVLSTRHRRPGCPICADALRAQVDRDHEEALFEGLDRAVVSALVALVNHGVPVDRDLVVEETGFEVVR